MESLCFSRQSMQLRREKFLMGPLDDDSSDFLLGDANDILFLILFCNARSSCLSLDLEGCFYLDLLSTEVRLVLAVPSPLAFFLWQLVLYIFESIYQKLHLTIEQKQIPFRGVLELIPKGSLKQKELIQIVYEMMQQVRNRSQIDIQEGITLDQTISNFAVVFHRSSPSTLEKLIGKQITSKESVSLIKAQHTFWLVKKCDSQEQYELQQIQRIVGLSQTVFCLQLTNSLEATVQKYFAKNQNQIFSSNKANKLIFIKDSYKEKQSASDIKYFQSVQKVHSWLRKGPYLSISSIRLFDLLQIYDCDLPQNVAKVKAIHQKYCEIQKIQDKIATAQNQIFNDSKSIAIAKSEILQMKLPKQVQGKLVWKLQQMHRYRNWIQEEEQTTFTQFSLLTFADVNQKLGFATVLKYRQIWCQNSLRKLKGLFRKIGTVKDSIAIKDFQKEYKAMKSNLDSIRKSLGTLPESKLFQEMESQLQRFYYYQNNIIQDAALSSLNYMVEQAKYLWKYENNFYKKMAVFLLLGALGYSQKDYIWGFTLLILAVITLTLRC